MEAQPIKTKHYLTKQEIQQHLKNVQYIVMATPAPDFFKDTPIHFTIFLNTDENLPKDIQEAILNKFLNENKISKTPKELMAQIMPVGFAVSEQDTPMPMLLVKPEDQKTIPYGVMFVYDFLSDSDDFKEVKEKSLTGWSYSYEE